jgi:hypothetical protein
VHLSVDTIFQIFWWFLVVKLQSLREKVWVRETNSLYLSFRRFDFERTWWMLFWAYLVNVILSVPDECYFERTWWMLFWAYLMNVILSVPDECYSRYTSCALNLISTYFVINSATFYWMGSTKQGIKLNYHIYLSSGKQFCPSFYNISIVFWNCSFFVVHFVTNEMINDWNRIFTTHAHLFSQVFITLYI